MRKLLPLVWVFASLSVPAATPTPETKTSPEDAIPAFTLLDTGHTAEGTLEPRDGGGFALSMVCQPGKTHVIAFAGIDVRLPAQHKLAFRFKGAKENGNAFLTVSLTTEENGTRVARHAPALPLGHTESKKAVLALDGDFRLSDTVWRIRELKFVVNGGDNPEGTRVVLEVEDVRFAAADALNATDTDFLVQSAYKRPEPRAVPGLEPVKVWFDFDNDDFTTQLVSRVSQGDHRDPPPVATFRRLLLEHADGIVAEVRAPEQADVVVYARAAQGDPAPALAALAAGKRLIAYGSAPDAALAERLPLALTRRSGGFPERLPVRAVDGNHAALRGQMPGGGDLGRYYDVNRRAGDIVLALADGTPLWVRAGRIDHFAAGLGAALLAGDVYYDKLLLRLIAAEVPAALDALDARERETSATRAERDRWLTESVAAAAGVEATPGKPFRVGMSEENVGRFGWLVGEGLSCADVARDLTVANGGQSYRFALDNRTSVTLGPWSRRAVDGNVTLDGKAPMTPTAEADPMELWEGAGTVEYVCEWRANPAWRGRELFFEVPAGIDDLDDARLNGREIGRTGEDAPNYWMTPRRYRLPEALVDWEGTNRLVVRVTNLRGTAAFNGPPLLAVRGDGGRATLSVEEANWVAKRYLVRSGERATEMTMSLLSPFARYRFDGPETSLALENVAEYLAYPAADGPRVVRLADRTDAYVRTRDGDWTAPWALLFRARAGNPLLLVFHRQPERIDAESRGGRVEGLRLAASGGRPLGVVAAGWPWGVTGRDGTEWTRPGALAGAVPHLERMVDWALHYPVGCDEIFRIDPDAGRVEIVNRFRFLREPDDWNTATTPFATLPPLVGFTLGRMPLAEAGPVEDFGLATRLGPTLGHRGRDTIRYTLPLPGPDDLLLPGIDGDSTLRKGFNDAFAGGVQWSCGGLTPVDAWTPARPSADFPIANIDLFAWNFGMTTALQGYFLLDDANRARLAERCRKRFLEPLELHQYKNFARHREEPFSGLSYPIAFNSFFPNATGYAPGLGSSVIYGDANEACTVAVWVARQLADVFGHAGMVRSHWRYFREVMRQNLRIDDYAFHAGSCREYGVGAWIDMLNGEYAGLVYYARLAAIAGDAPERDQGLYRAAKRALPTVLRLRFGEYLSASWPDSGWTPQALVTGFGESGPKFMRFPLADNPNHIHAMDLFDLSQGSPGALYRLYQRYAQPDIANYLDRLSLPSLVADGQPVHMGPAYLQALWMFPEPVRPLEAWAEAVLHRSAAKLARDWPGMTAPYHFGGVLWRQHRAPALSRCENVALREARFDPATRILALELVAGEDGLVEVECPTPLLRAERDGQPVTLAGGGERYRLPIPAGRSLWRLHYEK